MPLKNRKDFMPEPDMSNLQMDSSSLVAKRDNHLKCSRLQSRCTCFLVGHASNLSYQPQKLSRYRTLHFTACKQHMAKHFKATTCNSTSPSKAASFNHDTVDDRLAVPPARWRWMAAWMTMRNVYIIRSWRWQGWLIYLTFSENDDEK